MIKELEFISNNSQEDWDNYLENFRDFNFNQSFKLGEYIKINSKKFDIKRFVLFNGKTPVVMAQVMYKKIKYFPFVIVLIKGGPLFKSSEKDQQNIKNIKKFIINLISLIKDEYKFYYLNINMTSEHTAENELLLRELGWNKPLIERSPYLTYKVPIYEDIEKNYTSFDSKWRNQLKKSDKTNHVYDWGNDIAYIKRYLELHNNMCKRKKMKNLMLTYDYLVSLNNNLKCDFNILLTKLNNEDICGCIILSIKNNAYYLYASSSTLAHKNCSSNGMIWFLIKKLKDMGIRELDLLGINPKKNKGGNHFKKGIGGKPFKFVGEWEYSSHSFLKLLVNGVLYFRK